MKLEKSAAAVNSVLGSVLRKFGYIVGALSLICVIFAIADQSAAGAYEALIVFLIILILCLIAIMTGTRIKRRFARFRQYVSLISLKDTTSIDDIAASFGKPVEFIKKDLQDMIKRKYFANAVLDLATNKIIINAGMTSGSSEAFEVYLCPNCGATGKKRQYRLEHCDYCGSPIK